jgi:hypothetical protein
MKLHNMHEKDFPDYEVGRRLKNALAQFRPPAQGRPWLLRAASAKGRDQSRAANPILSLILSLLAVQADTSYGGAIPSFQDLRYAYSTGIRLAGFTF